MNLKGADTLNVAWCCPVVLWHCPIGFVLGCICVTAASTQTQQANATARRGSTTLVTASLGVCSQPKSGAPRVSLTHPRALHHHILVHPGVVPFVGLDTRRTRGLFFTAHGQIMCNETREWSSMQGCPSHNPARELEPQRLECLWRFALQCLAWSLQECQG